MKRIVEFPTTTGESVWVEVADDEVASGLRPAGRGEEGLMVKAHETFEHALQSVRPAAIAIIGAFRDLKPDELEIAIGIKLTTEANALIAATAAEGNIGVRLVWKKEPVREKA